MMGGAIDEYHASLRGLIFSHLGINGWATLSDVSGLYYKANLDELFWIFIIRKVTWSTSVTICTLVSLRNRTP